MRSPELTCSGLERPDRDALRRARHVTVVGQLPVCHRLRVNRLDLSAGQHQGATVVGPAGAALRMDAEKVEIGPAELRRLRAETLEEVKHVGVRLLPMIAVEAGARALCRAQALDAGALGVEVGGRNGGEVRGYGYGKGEGGAPGYRVRVTGGRRSGPAATVPTLLRPRNTFSSRCRGGPGF